jgi:hypothetical protein
MMHGSGLLAASFFVQRIDRLLVTAYAGPTITNAYATMRGQCYFILYIKSWGHGLWLQQPQGRLPHGHSKNIFPAAHHQLPCTAIQLVAARYI